MVHAYLELTLPVFDEVRHWCAGSVLAESGRADNPQTMLLPTDAMHDAVGFFRVDDLQLTQAGEVGDLNDVERGWFKVGLLGRVRC